MTDPRVMREHIIPWLQEQHTQALQHVQDLQTNMINAQKKLIFIQEEIINNLNQHIEILKSKEKVPTRVIRSRSKYPELTPEMKLLIDNEVIKSTPSGLIIEIIKRKYHDILPHHKTIYAYIRKVGSRI
jgi:hypothetical protein